MQPTTRPLVLTDLDVSYEFAGKRGVASLRVTNAFDRRFASIVEDFLQRPQRILASARDQMIRQIKV